MALHVDVLVETDAEHGDFDALHGVRTVVNDGEAAANDGLAAKQSAVWIPGQDGRGARSP